MDTKTRKCGNCESIKSVDEFWEHRKNGDGKQHFCKNCLRKLKNEWMKKMKSTPEGRRKITIDNLYQNAKARSRKRGLEFNLTKDYISSLFMEECPILKIKFVLCDGKARSNSPSIDRIDNKGGYTVGNIAVISRRANTIKKDGLLAEFLAIRDYIKSNII